jgi:ABC-2 type transport system ATP-binding protein
MSSTDNAVVVDGIRKTFGSVMALADISFKVGRGEVLGLLGPNGAGKTTTVDILSTLTRPDHGHAEVAGHSVLSDPAGVRRSIMPTGQHVALDEMLTGRENLVMFGRLRGLKRSQARSRASELLDQFDLVGAADRCVSTYSGGMRRRIDIACGLVVRPEVVFLDEPTTGLDPRSRQSIWELVSDFKKAGIATLLTTQYLEEADTLSDRIIVIDHGKIIAEGTADELKERTGATYCEIVPRHLADLPAMAEALGSLLPEKNRAALTTGSDRVAIPAPNGPNTLVQALHQLNVANIELLDIALRRPSLDEVFFALTSGNVSEVSAARVDVAELGQVPGRHRVARNGDTSAVRVDVAELGHAAVHHHEARKGDTSAVRVDVAELGHAAVHHHAARKGDMSAKRLGPFNRDNGLKWAVGAVTVLAVIATAVVAVLLFRGGHSGNGSSAAPAKTGSTPHRTAIASATDTAPVSVVINDPTCAAWTHINDLVTSGEGRWSDRDRSVPASAWTEQQRAQYLAAGQAMRGAAAQTVGLVKLTPHRVMRELYEQFIAYARAYAQRIPNYIPADNNLAGTASSASSALGAVCAAIADGSAAARGPLVPPSAAPAHTSPVGNPANPQPYLTSLNPVCADWKSALAQFGKNTAAWEKFDPNIPAIYWNRERKAINDAVAPEMTMYANRLEQLGRQSGNSVLQDFASLAAQYRRAFVVALPTYVPADNYLANAATYASTVVLGACAMQEI